MKITEKVKSYIKEHQLLEDYDKVIVGLSGGADSMALLNILIECGYKCIAAHCNFHLRGEESDRDEKFVAAYCKEKNIPFVKISFDTKKYMQEKSISLEMAARELRYEWFEALAEEYTINNIAIAHHQDDSIETVLINLIRGTGIRGLTGIKPRNGKIVRPLLCIYRSEVNEYIDSRNIPFVEDSSNKEDIAVRNKLRLEIIPALEKINPSVKQSISRTANNLSEVESIYSESIEKIKKDVFDGKYIDIPALERYPQKETILFEILYPLGFNPSVIEEVANSVNGISGKIFYSSTEYYLLKDRNKFILDKKIISGEKTYIIQEEEQEITEPLNLFIEVIEKDENRVIPKDKNTLSVDFSKICFPLHIRKWKRGDRFYPFGMKGSKKVSDYFTDRKFTLIQKQEAWLLCSAKDEIIWILGERPDNRFKVNERTKKILQIVIKEEK